MTDHAVDDAALIDLAVQLARTSSVSGTEGAAVALAASAMTAAGFAEVDVDASGNQMLDYYHVFTLNGGE